MTTDCSPMNTQAFRLPTDFAGTREDYHLPPEKRLRGDPLQSLWLHYSDAAGESHVGTWRSEPGLWRVAYTEQEYCEMLEGVCVLTPDGGAPFTVRAGDRFVVPPGFTGTWEVVETASKRFVIHEAKRND